MQRDALGGMLPALDFGVYGGLLASLLPALETALPAFETASADNSTDGNPDIPDWPDVIAVKSSS